MAIDRAFLTRAAEYIANQRGKLGPHTRDLLDDGLAMRYYSDANEIVAARCRDELESMMANGVRTAQERKEFVCILEYMSQLKDAPAGSVEYTGRNQQIKLYICKGKGGPMSKTNTWFDDSIESVKKFVQDNIDVLRVFRADAQANGDNDVVDNIDRTIEEYQKVLERVDELRHTLAERQPEVAQSLQDLRRYVLGNRPFIKGGEYAANLNMNNSESCFVKMNAALDEAFEVYQTPAARRAGKPATYSDDEVEYRRDGDFVGILTLASKRQTYAEIYRNIENRLHMQDDQHLQARLTELNAQLDHAKRESDKYADLYENGGMPEEDALAMVDTWEDTIEMLQEQISDINYRITDNISSNATNGIIWQTVCNEIDPFVKESGPMEFLCFADDIIAALRNVYAFLTGNVEAGQNYVQLNDANACVNQLRAVRMQATQRRNDMRYRMRQEQREAREQMRSLRSGSTQRQTAVSAENALDRRRRRMEQAETRRTARDQRATNGNNDKPIIIDDGSINDD